jgi:phosphoglycerol transferase MdoB-like AlkP superfamily enzyme
MSEFKLLKFPKRFQLLKTFGITFFTFSFIVRIGLYFLSFENLDFSILAIIKIFSIGLLFDIGSFSYIAVIYCCYLLLIPQRLHGSKIDKIITKFTYGLFLFILIFSFLTEVPFWQEYNRRFNFIAVDYLLYTYEVLENIHQSFPVPLLVIVILLILVFSIGFAKKREAYKNTFNNNDQFISKLFPSILIFIVFGLFHFNIKNSQAEVFNNVNENEIAKSGLYSFFAAYKSNELNFNDFYETLPEKENYQITRNSVNAINDSLLKTSNSILRFTKNLGEEKKPNVIFIGLESMSARYLNRYGNTKNLTPTIDSLHKKSIAFTNMYATGNRTIRGIEAISLAIPPTPGRSIVKRKNNKNLFTIGEIFKQKGYSRTFIYGGDADFDNMLNYFSYNEFDIIDRRKWHRPERYLPTKRVRINDDEVTFENAWATCDGNLFNKLLKVVDLQHKEEKPFFNFVLTSSNHPPYSFPKGVIDSENQTRNNVIKYSDKALFDFFEKAKTKPWFKNTVFVLMADHCSNSAGRTEINIKNHHIPAFIYNLEGFSPLEVDKLSSQIDIFPTLFGYLDWSYKTNLFGKDISKMSTHEERAFIGNHRKVSLLKQGNLLVLETQKQHTSYHWNKEKNLLSPIETDSILLKETISYYQTAFDLFKSGEIKLNSTQKIK